MATIVPLAAPREAKIDLEAEARFESCGALKDYWYVAALATELRDRPLARTILGVPIVLFRDPSGKPAALFDRCLHRNACLSAGEVFDGTLGCPYHGWTYDASGACVEIPSLGPEQKGSHLTPAPCDVGRVKSFATLEQDGLIYVLPGEKARRPAFRVPYAGDPSWTVYFMVTRFPNGVTNLVQNFMDVPHTVFVHEKWFRNRARKKVPATVERVDESVLVTYRQESDRISGMGRLFNPRGTHPMVHTDNFYAPNVTRVDYGFGAHGFVINSQCTPISATDSLVYTAISYRTPFGRLFDRAMRRAITWYTTQVIRQDVEIMEIQRKGLTHAPGGGRFVSTEADLLHSDMEDLRTWLLHGAPPDATPPDEKRDIQFWI